MTPSSIVLAIAIVLGSAASASAQTSSSPDAGRDARATSADPCAADLGSDHGIVTLAIDDAARANASTRVSIDELTYMAHFDAGGRLRFQAPMFYAISDVEWSGQDGHTCRRHGLRFVDFDSAYRLAVVWSGPFQLALHIIEPPDGRLGGARDYIDPNRPNTDGTIGLGSLRHFGDPAADTAQVELYTLPADRKPPHGYFLFLTEFLDRGNPAGQPYCGNGPEARVLYAIRTIAAGQSDRKKFVFPISACGQTWDTSNSDSGYYQKFSQNW